MSKYWNIPAYSQLSAEELRRKAEESTKKASQKGRKMEPVIVEGRKIAQTWWGQAWCYNLEKYADYASRLGRGKNYVRSGAVIDLNITKGKILARVQGRRKSPYKVEIHISPLKEEACQNIMNACANQIENLEALVSGDFPKELQSLFTGEHGLFPNPKEISFNCSCPDWAIMCKHVAAVLYGVGTRLDENPFLFFTLRGIDLTRFIDVTIGNKVEQMLSNANEKSSRVIDDISIYDLFGV